MPQEEQEGEAPQQKLCEEASPDVPSRRPPPPQGRGGRRGHPPSPRARQPGSGLCSPVPPSSSLCLLLHQAAAAGSLLPLLRRGLQPSSSSLTPRGCCGARAPVSGGTLGLGGLLGTWVGLLLPLCWSWELRGNCRCFVSNRFVCGGWGCADLAALRWGGALT